MAIAPRIPPRPMAKPALAPKPVAKPVMAPAAKPSANPFTGGKTTTLAQRQAYQPFKSATKPTAPKVNPMAGQPAQQQGGVLVNGQPFNPPPMSYEPDWMLAGKSNPLDPNPTPSPILEPAFGGGYNPGQSPMGEPTLPYMGGPIGGGFGGGKSTPGQVNNDYNGYQVGGDINIDPVTGQPTPWQPDSMPMDYGNQPNSYNGQLDLTGMMGQQGQQQAVPQNMYGTQPSATPGGKSTGSSSSNASYGGGKSR